MGQANCCWRSRRGTTLRPQLRLALDQLWVLSSGKEAAGDIKEEEEEEGSDEDGTSILLMWPSGTCVVTFGSRALKQLWLGKLLGTPEGATGARVTNVPSIKLLQKELSRRHGWRTFSARSLERLMEGQTEADPKQGPPTAPSTSGGGLCHSPEPGRCPGARAGGLRLQQGALWAAPGSPLRGGRHAAPAHPGAPGHPVPERTVDGGDLPQSRQRDSAPQAEGGPRPRHRCGPGKPACHPASCHLEGLSAQHPRQAPRCQPLPGLDASHGEAKQGGQGGSAES
ncbi:unnamed protein product, partial [Bubo scandiacus]